MPASASIMPGAPDDANHSGQSLATATNAAALPSSTYSNHPDRTFGTLANTARPNRTALGMIPSDRLNPSARIPQPPRPMPPQPAPHHQLFSAPQSQFMRNRQQLHAEHNFIDASLKEDTGSNSKEQWTLNRADKREQQ